MRAHDSLTDFLRAFRFPVYLISGRARHGHGNLRLLYAGSDPTRAYLTSLAFRGRIHSDFLGKQTHVGFLRCTRKTSPDLDVFRSHSLLASSPLFSRRFFVPDWISGEANLRQQETYEGRSRSRQRDRRLIERNGIDYSVTTELSALNYFYDEMYVPHITAAHRDAALFMNRDRMLHYVRNSKGELLLIQLRGHAVAGSFVVYEDDMPRLFSGGVLNHDRNLLRKGVGAAIYLLSFDYLRNKGYLAVKMGRTRPFLSDGALYFKQRFGLTVSSVSHTGLLMSAHVRTRASALFMQNNGLIHLRNGVVRAALLHAGSGSDIGRVARNQKELAQSLGITEFDQLHFD